MQGDSDSELVAAVLRDLAEAADRCAAALAEAEATTFSVDLGDVVAVADTEGRLVGLTLSPAVTSTYSPHELAARLNGAFAALRDAIAADFRSRYAAMLS